jgi:hypothetical protein
MVLLYSLIRHSNCVQLSAPTYFQILSIGENGKLADYSITTEWINIKNKINNEHHQVPGEGVSLSEQSIYLQIFTNI